MGFKRVARLARLTRIYHPELAMMGRRDQIVRDIRDNNLLMAVFGIACATFFAIALCA